MRRQMRRDGADSDTECTQNVADMGNSWQVLPLAQG